MTDYFVTLIITFAVIAAFAAFINFCRRRIRKTQHGLTGMCHKNGGAMCSSCRDQIENNPRSS